MAKGWHQTKAAKCAISKAMKGNQHALGHQNTLGYHHTKETRRKISEALKGNQHTLGWHHTEETKRKIGEATKRRPNGMLGKHPTEETRRKLSEANKGRKKPPRSEEHIHNWIASNHIKPNCAERKLNAILQEICPGEFALNVRGEIMILDGRIPDFVNVNGKKQLIELYGDYWHNPKYFPERQSPQDRINHFRHLGWDTLIIWEYELKDLEEIKERILGFIGGKHEDA